MKIQPMDEEEKFQPRIKKEFKKVIENTRGAIAAAIIILILVLFLIIRLILSN